MINKMRSESGSDIDEKIGYRDTIKENVARVKHLRKSLEDWREVLAPMYGVLVWREEYYPAVLSSVVTLLFFVVWYADPPLLTLIAVLGMTATTADYVVPALCQALFRPEDWTAAKEREFERMCQLLAEMTSSAESAWCILCGWKQEKPKVYFVAMAFSLFVLAWLGNNVNNLFLMYALALFLVLYPGMKHRGLIKKYMAESIIFITNKIRPHRAPPADGERVKLE